MKCLLAAAAALLLAGPAAAAVTTTFDLRLQPGQSTSHGDLPASFQLTQDGLTATFRAGAFVNALDNQGADRNLEHHDLDGDGRQDGYLVGSTRGGDFDGLDRASDPRVGRYAGGAGVVSGPGDLDHMIDGQGWYDFLEIVFEIPVVIHGLDFSFHGNHDHQRWGYDRNGDGVFGNGDYLSYKRSKDPHLDFIPETVSSNLFSVGAYDGNDDWLLKTVTVRWSPADVPLAATPLPAAGLVLLTALAGAAAAYRRRKA